MIGLLHWRQYQYRRRQWECGRCDAVVLLLPDSTAVSYLSRSPPTQAAIVFFILEWLLLVPTDRWVEKHMDFLSVQVRQW